MGGGHHHRGGGWRGGYGPVWWGQPWQAPATEVFVVDDGAKARRIIEFVLSLPKSQQRAAYERLTGRPASELAAKAFGDTDLRYLRNARAADTLALGAMGYLPTPGAPESLAGCGCGCGGSGACVSLGGVVDRIASLPTAAKVAGAVGLYFLYKKFKKR